jgi:hypothetical protein
MRSSLIVDGQSLNTGPPAWADLLMDGVNRPYAIIARNGYAWATPSSQGSVDLTTTLGVRIQNRGWNSAYSVMTLLGGTSDLANGNTGATVYDRMVDHAALAKATYGVAHVIACTITPSASTFDAGEETARQDCNTLLLANTDPAIDEVVDLAGDTRLDDSTDTTYYHPDQLHLNATGYAVVAELMEPSVYAALGV